MLDDDKIIARKLVQADLQKVLARARESGTDSQVVAFDANGMEVMPPGDGDRMLIPLHIGARGSPWKPRARVAAEVWRKITRRYPKGAFVVALLGYDQDPREIWEIPEAARYVRWWAQYAGMGDLETADGWLGAGSAIGQSDLPHSTAGMGFLAACGVFGGEIKRQVLAGSPPTVAH
jgi:hypothetical protein